MGQKQTRLAKCTATKHIENVFNCQAEYCNVKPMLCNRCSYKSKRDALIRFCKLCRLTEQCSIRDEDGDSDEDLDEENFKPSTTFTKIYSASHD